MVAATLDHRGQLAGNVHPMLLSHRRDCLSIIESTKLTGTSNDAGSRFVHKMTAKCQKQLQQFTPRMHFILNLPQFSYLDLKSTSDIARQWNF